jgi:acyl-CoA synthetase (AMP-forming)/AMP-acid ligase II
MKYLAQALAKRDASQVLWWTPVGESFTAGALSKELASRDVSFWRGCRVGLGTMSVLELAKTLVFLDGIAESLLFLPVEQEPEVQQKYLTDANIDVVLGNEAPTALHHTGPMSGANRILLQTENHLVTETQWLLPTSGTTGIPKLIGHTLKTLTRSMSPRYVGDRYVWASLYHPRRFAGLQVLLQSWISGTPLILDDDFTMSPNYLARLSRLGCNALSATPSMWRKLAMCPGFESLPLMQITLGGEMVDQPVLDMLRRNFPTARITHIYASTEAGVGFAVRDGLAGFPLSYIQSPPGKVAMRIDAEGHLWFCPNGLAPKELGVRNQLDDWIDSGDLVRITEDRVHFLGRASGSINVGGSKVMPEEVEAVIKEVPGVAFAIVKGRRNALMGNLVEAHVAPQTGISFDEMFKRRITDHCRRRLDAFKVPAFIKPMDQIELNAVGKIGRQELV